MTELYIGCQRDLFNVPADITYLNCAFLSPKPKAVIEAGKAGIQYGQMPWQIKAESFFTEREKARNLFAKIISAQADDIAIIPAVSYGIANACSNVKVSDNQEIVILDEQFPSNVYPWYELAKYKKAKVITVETPQDHDWTKAVLARICEKTAVVALPQCHWTDGGYLDLAKISKRCQQVSAHLVIDATQSLGALDFSVHDIDADFVVAAGYKWLLGPYSLGFMYVNPRHHEGHPIEHNWISRKNSEDFSKLVDYQYDFQKGARRFDVGESSNFILLPMAIAAMEQLLSWQIQRIHATIELLTDHLAEQATSIGLSVKPKQFRSPHMLGIMFPKMVDKVLLKQLEQNKIYVSARGHSLRISPHIYNDQNDIDKLISVLAQLKH